MKRFGMMSTAALFLLFGSTALVYAVPNQGQGQQDQKDKKDKKQGKPDKQTNAKKQQGQPARHQEQQVQRQQDQNRQQQQREQQARDQNSQRQQEQQRALQQDQRNQQQRAQQQQDLNNQQRAQQERVRAEQAATTRRQQQDQANQQRAEQVRLQQQQTPPGWDKGKKVGWGGSNVPPGQNKQQQGRLSQLEQQQRIELQQRNYTVYRQSLDQQVRLAQQQNAMLQQQQRMAQYRYQQDYYERLRQQQIRLQNEQNYNYNNDPYYYTGWTYQYNRGGNNYQTNQYGADLLRQAVNNGYQEGFRAGRADRQDRWRSNYQDSYSYQDANFGYNGRYVQQDEYNYYFRQGFQRGYQDGFSGRYQYGSYSNGRYSILGAILGGILNLRSIN